MILDWIRLENFGAYGGINEAELTPEKGKPVVLFGGMNGGKLRPSVVRHYLPVA